MSYYLTPSSKKFNPHLFSVIAVVQMVQSKKTRWTREVTMSHEIESEIWHTFNSLGVILAELGQGRSRIESVVGT